MRPENQLLSLPELQKMHRAGNSPIVLREIEDNLVMQAVEVRMLEGSNFNTRAELLEVASSLIPHGERLTDLYNETARNMGQHSAEHLAMVAENIEGAVHSLEAVAGKAQAQLKSQTVPAERREQIDRAIGARFADLILAAEHVQAQGGPPAVFNLNVVSADERPDGPLGAFYDAAIADLRSRGKLSMKTDLHERMRG